MAKTITIEEAVAQLTNAIREDIIFRMIGAKPVTSTTKSKPKPKSKGPRGKFDEAKVIEFLGNKEMPVKDVSKGVKLGMQSLTKRLKAAHTKFKVRNEDENNPRSALLVKAK